MLNLIILIFLIYLIINQTGYVKYKDDQVSINEYKTKYFTPNSLELFDELKEGGLSDQSLLEFATMEDQFMKYEHKSVCENVSYFREATMLNEQMKDRFLGWDFRYHQKHLQQIAQPEKIINKNLSCS